MNTRNNEHLDRSFQKHWFPLRIGHITVGRDIYHQRFLRPRFGTYNYTPNLYEVHKGVSIV